MPIGINIIIENGNIQFENINYTNIRPHKGKSLLSLPDDYSIIDIETTGLYPECDEIIEISVLRCRNDNIVDKYSTLVCPDDLSLVDDFITELTGITQEMLKGKPHIQEILSEVINFIGEDIVIAHNANFDINFIYDKCDEFINHIFSNNFVDTLRISRRALPALKNHKLTTIAEFFTIDTNGAHRSEKDCEIMHECYKQLKKIVLENPSLMINKSELDLRTLTSANININPDNPFYGKECVFTGKLERMVRADAAQLVVNLGGTAGNNVTKKTNFLILGNNDYCSTIKNGKSSKQKKAEQLILSGASLEIIPEDVFYEMLSSYREDLE